MEDGEESALLDEAILYITEKRYPEEASENRKRAIRRKAKKFEIQGGELFYRDTRKCSGEKVEVLLKYIRNEEERKAILHSCHIEPTSGHLGRVRTMYRIKERFMWTGMYKDVQQLVMTCDVCQLMNRKLTTGTPCLNPIPVKSPWYMIGIDFIGPIRPRGNDGNQFILTVTDYFTKWAEAATTPDKSAVSVASVLFKLFMRLGLPRVILSDNGREFNNCLDQCLAKLLGIKRRLTTPYHPQANGLVERLNQTLQGMLVKYTNSDKREWSSFIDTCVFAYNTSRHDSSKFTPFELMYGRCATLPIDLSISRRTPEEDADSFMCFEDPDMSDVETQRAKRLKEAKENICAAQKKQKIDFDKKHAKPHLFKQGQQVLKKDFMRKKRRGGKLDTRYLGPYIISKVLGRGTYELTSADGSKVRATGAHLKPYFKPSVDITSPVSSLPLVTRPSTPGTPSPLISRASTPSLVTLVTRPSTPGRFTPGTPSPLISRASTPSLVTLVTRPSTPGRFTPGTPSPLISRASTPSLVTLVTRPSTPGTPSSLTSRVSTPKLVTLVTRPSTPGTPSSLTSRVSTPKLVTLVTRPSTPSRFTASPTLTSRVSTPSVTRPSTLGITSRVSTQSIVTHTSTLGTSCTSTLFSQVVSSPSLATQPPVPDGDVFMWLSPFQLNHYHLNQLINGEWLHVELVEMYLSLIKKLYPTTCANSVILPSHILDLVESAGTSVVEQYRDQLNDTILSTGLMIIPVIDHQRHHFILMTVNFSTHHIEVYDSDLLATRLSATISATHYTSRLRKLLQVYFLAERNHLKDSTWPEIIHYNIPQQNDGSSCGLFVCKYGKCLMLHCPVEFEGDPDALRSEIVSDFEKSLSIYPELCLGNATISESLDDSIAMSAICRKCKFHLPLRELHHHIIGCSPKNGVDVALLDGECNGQRVIITDADLCTLIDGCWLNDKLAIAVLGKLVVTSGRDHPVTIHSTKPMLSSVVINFYMFILNLEERRASSQLMTSPGQTYCVNSFFYASIQNYRRNQSSAKPLAYVKVELIQLSRLLVPICYSNHWVLLEFNFDCHKVVSYDSLPDNFNTAAVTEIGNFLSEVYLEKYEVDVDFDNWQREASSEVTLQSNSNDCGVFLCKYASALVRGTSVKVTVSEVQRKLLLEEILNSPSIHSEIRLLNYQVFVSFQQKLQSVLTHNQQVVYQQLDYSECDSEHFASSTGDSSDSDTDNNSVLSEQALTYCSDPDDEWDHQLTPYTEDTLPKGILFPDFCERSCVLDEDDIFITSTIRDYWLRGFPKLERPSDEECVFKRNFIRETLKRAEPQLRRAAKGEIPCRFAEKGFYTPNNLDLHDQWPLELNDMYQEVFYYLVGVASDILQRILCTGGDIVNHILLPEAMTSLICHKFGLEYNEGAVAFKRKILPI